MPTQRQRSDPRVSHPLPYAPRPTSRWTPYQKVLLVLCCLDYAILGILTADLLYVIPGERYLIGQGNLVGRLGFVLAPASLPILIASFVAESRILVALASGLILLSIVWTIRYFVLLSYL